MNEEKSKFSEETENLKNETKATVDEVKDTIKNVNFKQDAVETKGFIKDMFANPVETVRKIATGEENVMKKVIIIMIVFIVASAICGFISVFKYGSIYQFSRKIMTILSSILYPLFYILVPSIVVLILNKDNKKNLTTVISTITIASIPVVANNVIDVAENLISGITIITSPISVALSAFAMILTYFGMKELFAAQDDGQFIKKFAVIKLIVAFVTTILSRIGIY